MVDRGQIVGYSASVTLDPMKITSNVSGVGVVRGFVQNLQSNLEMAGLLIVDYRVKAGNGQFQVTCKFILQTARDFPSKQAIVNLVSNQITQTTGTPPRWAVDPPASGCLGCRAARCSFYCGPACCAKSTLQLGGSWNQFTSWVHNAVYGTLSTCQQRALVCQEKSALIQSGVNPCIASQIAASDVAGALKANCAAPCQSCFWNSAGIANLKKNFPMFALPVLGIALAVLLLVVFVGSAGRTAAGG